MRGFIFKQNIVCPIRVERRIEINEIDAFVNEIIPKNIDVVAVKECVLCQSAWHCSPFLYGSKNDKWSYINTTNKMQEVTVHPCSTERKKGQYKLKVALDAINIQGYFEFLCQITGYFIAP
jgi:hypothetical protein